MRIYKYTINPLGVTEHRMNQGAKMLSTHEQDNGICVWAEVGTGPMVNYYFHAFPTGMEVDATDLNYIGTTLLAEGQLVNHVYYKEEKCHL